VGTRGNIVIEEQRGGVIYLYSHWDSYRLPGLVATALKRGRDRWDDEPYLARVLASELFKSDIDGITGYGLSTTMGDGGVEVYVDMGAQRVRYGNGNWSFDEFIGLTFDKDGDLPGWSRYS